MPIPLPTPDSELLEPPDAAEVAFLSRGVVTAVSGDTGLTELQQILIGTMFEAMTGFPADLEPSPITPIEFAEGLAHRNEMFRSRILQVMLLATLILRPLPDEVAERVGDFARELSVDDGMLRVARDYAVGDLGIASVDFERNGYTADWSPASSAVLHTSRELADAWELAIDDAELANRWRRLEDLEHGTLGRAISEFYRARGFRYPGNPGSAPPLLAQHDWVHVIADYGSTVESELEVFAFIARANDDPRGFSLLAMVVSLFETGYLSHGAGLFEAYPDQLSREGVAVRVADAMRRGALVSGSVDFMSVDWFAHASEPLDAVRRRFGLVAKSPSALRNGSVGPFEQGGISEFQLEEGQRLAAEEGRTYDTFGASL